MLWVRDLIEQGSNKWNLHIIKDTLIPYDNDIINQIPISNQNEKDIVMWMANKHGKYSVKFGYHFLHD